MVHLLAELSDTKSNVKLGGFRSQLQASYVIATLKSCDTTKQSVDDYIYIYIYIYIYVCVCVCYASTMGALKV